MTNEEVSETFTIWKSGKDYICVPPFELAQTCMQRYQPIGGADFPKDPPIVDAYRRVVDALPGPLLDLVERTRLNKATIYTVLSKLRRQGKLVQSRPADGFVVYGVRVTGQS